jgi:hypothetical protein
MTTTELRKLQIKNRIVLLQTRKADNGRIVKKLEREYARLTGTK